MRILSNRPIRGKIAPKRVIKSFRAQPRSSSSCLSSLARARSRLAFPSPVIFCFPPFLNGAGSLVPSSPFLSSLFLSSWPLSLHRDFSQVLSYSPHLTNSIAVSSWLRKKIFGDKRGGMAAHQIIAGALNKGEHVFGVGNVDGIQFTACAVGTDLVILASNFERVQVIPAPQSTSDVDYRLVTSVSCCNDSGKIAATYGNAIRIFEPTHNILDNATHSLNYRWFETQMIREDAAIDFVVWDKQGTRLVGVGNAKLYLYQDRSLNSMYSRTTDETIRLPTPLLFEVLTLFIRRRSHPSLLTRCCKKLATLLLHPDHDVRHKAVDLLYALSLYKYRRCVDESGQRSVPVQDQSDDFLAAITNVIPAMVQVMTDHLGTLAYTSKYEWYFDVTLILFEREGDLLNDDVTKFIQIVVNREDVQRYAAKSCFEALERPACHENMVKVGGYILGEFGNLIAGDQRSSPSIQFHMLHSKYHLCSISTRSLLLAAYVKFSYRFPEIKPMIQDVLNTDHNLRNPDAELRQRAVEYLAMSKIVSADLLATVLEEMPPFAEKESSLFAKLKKSKPQQEKDKKSRPSAVMATDSSSTEAVSGSLVDVDSARKESTLSDVFQASPAASSEMRLSSSTGGDPDVFNASDYLKFVTKNKGILYEDDNIQICFTLETNSSLARLYMFYGNKTGGAFINFNPQCLAGGSLGVQLQVQARPIDTEVDVGAQVQQLINIVCVQEFTKQLIMHLTFNYHDHNSVQQSFDKCLYLPIFINKFFEPIEMSDQFNQRILSLLRDPAHVEETNVPATKRMGTRDILAMMGEFGLRKLKNWECYDAAWVGMLNTETQQIGALVKLELDMQGRMYRLTVRTSKDTVSKQLAKLIASQL